MSEWPAHVFPAELRAEERELTAKISELSERCLYAGWLGECEYEVWDMAVHGIRPNPHNPQFAWGHCGEAELVPMVEAIASFARSIGRWVVWDDEIPADMAVRAVPLAEWEEMFNAWKAARGA